MLLIVAVPVYGVPAMQLPARALAGILVGAVAFVSCGILLGSVLRSARAAQAVGLLLFFPSFLLGSGGPPPDVMGSALRRVADVLPLTQVTKAIREPWLGLGTASTSLIIVGVLAVAATAVAARRAAL
jgi:ABC-2 type transport system permease protein